MSKSSFLASRAPRPGGSPERPADDAHAQRPPVPIVAREELRLPLAVPLRLRLAALRARKLVEDAHVLAEEERAGRVASGLPLDCDGSRIRGPLARRSARRGGGLAQLHGDLARLRLEPRRELRVRGFEETHHLVGLLGRRFRLEPEAFVLADLGRGRGDAAEEEQPSEHDPYATLPRAMRGRDR